MRLVLGENDVLFLLYFVKICGLYVRKRGVCGVWIWIYPWISMDISMDIHEKSVDMDMDMNGKFHIHGKPG